MNIHEHQAKELLSEYGIPIPRGIVVFNVQEIKEKIKKLNSKNFVIKAQIHAGGRGKSGGIKVVKSIDELLSESKKMYGIENFFA